MHNIKPISNLKGYMAYPNLMLITPCHVFQLLRDEAPELSLKHYMIRKDFLVLLDAIDPGSSGLRTLKYIKEKEKSMNFIEASVEPKHG